MVFPLGWYKSAHNVWVEFFFSVTIKNRAYSTGCCHCYTTIALPNPLVNSKYSQPNLQEPAQIVYFALTDAVVKTNNSSDLTTEVVYFTKIDLLYVAFVVAFLFAIGRTMVKGSRLYALIARSYCWKRIGKLSIHISDEVSIPFSTQAFLRSQIVIPENLVSKSPFIPVIIAHEGQHLRNGDTAWEIAFEALVLAFVWNPFAYAWRSSLSQLQEYACDEAVIGSGKVKSFDYGQCLLEVVECVNHTKFSPVASSCMAGKSLFGGIEKSKIMRRISMMAEMRSRNFLKWPPLIFRSVLLAGLVAVGLVVASCTNNFNTQTDELQLVSRPSNIQYLVQLYEFIPNEDQYQNLDWGNLPQKLDLSGSVDNRSFEDYEEALRKYGKVELISRPRVITENNQQIFIQSGSEYEIENVQKIINSADKVLIERSEGQPQAIDSLRQMNVLVKLDITPNLQFASPEKTEPTKIRQHIDFSVTKRLENIRTENFENATVSLIDENSEVIKTDINAVSMMAIDLGLRESDASVTKGLVALIQPSILIAPEPKPGDVVLDIVVDIESPRKDGGEEGLVDFTNIETQVFLRKDEKLVLPPDISELDQNLISSPEQLEIKDSVEAEDGIKFHEPFKLEVTPVVDRNNRVNLAVKLYDNVDGNC